MAATAVTRAHNRAIAKGSDPKAATCRAKLQRARSALNRQMDRELRLREGAENLLRATTKDGSGDNSMIGGGSGGRNKSKNRKHIRQTVALELSFLDSNVRLLADELAELNGSVDVYQHRDDDDDDDVGGVGYDDFDGRERRDPGRVRQRRRQRQMPMIAVPLKDTRPIDFGPPLERFISQHYGVDVSKTSDGKDEGEYPVSDDGNDYYGSGTIRRRSLSLREAIDELTQLRMDTQTPSRDADGVRLLLRYYRQLYYVDRRFFPPPSVTPTVTTTPRCYNHNPQQHQHQQDHHHHQHHRHNNPQHTAVGCTDTLSTLTPPPAIHFEWYDSFGGPVPSCGQRTVRFEQACVLFNVAAVHTQMGAKHDRRCSGGGSGGGGGRDDDDNSGVGKPTSSSSTSTGPDAVDGAVAAAQCFLRAAGAYRHIGDTFANAPARAADLRATGVLYAVMMAQANECVFEKTQWRLLSTVRHRCRHHRCEGGQEGHRRRILPAGVEGSLGGGDRRIRADRDTKTRRTSAAVAVGAGRMNDVIAQTPTWTELAREAAHVSRMYAEVVYNSCRPGDGAAHGGKENGGELVAPPSVLPEVWVSVCRIKDRHYAALAYRYAACALLPYYRGANAEPADGRHSHGGSRHRDRGADAADVNELLLELLAAAAAVGLEVLDDDDDDDYDDDEMTSVPMRQERRRRQIGKLLLEAAASTHDRAARAQRLCRQLRAKTEGTTSGGLLAGVLDRERQRTLRLLRLHRREDDDNNDSEYVTAEGDDDENRRCCCRRRRCVTSDDAATNRDRDYHECWSDDDGTDAATTADHDGDHEEFTEIAGIPGLDVDRGVLIRPRTRFRLAAIAPDFTDTGDCDDGEDGEGDEDEEADDNGDDTTIKRRGGQRQRRARQHETADREERRADLFAGLGPVAVFSARHRCTRPRWVKVARGNRHHSTGDIVAAVGGGGSGYDDDDTAVASTDPIQLVDRWFGFELRCHGGGTAAAVPPATIGHVRSGSLAQHAGLRRGDIVVALKCAGDSGSRVLDVRWDTCRGVAELVVNQHQRRRHLQTCPSGGVVAQLKVVTPITNDGYATMDPAKMYCRRRTNAIPMCPSLHSGPLPPPMTMPQSASKQQYRQKRFQSTNGGHEVTESSNKLHTWSWNPFRLRRRSVPSNKC